MKVKLQVLFTFLQRRWRANTWRLERNFVRKIWCNHFSCCKFIIKKPHADFNNFFFMNRRKNSRTWKFLIKSTMQAKILRLGFCRFGRENLRTSQAQISIKTCKNLKIYELWRGFGCKLVARKMHTCSQNFKENSKLLT